MSGFDLMSYLLLGRLERLAASQDRDDAGAQIRRRAAANAAAARAEIQRENEWLRTLVRALAELCLEKGLISEKELKDRIAKIDADDAARKPADRAGSRIRKPG